MAVTLWDRLTGNVPEFGTATETRINSIQLYHVLLCWAKGLGGVNKAAVMAHLNIAAGADQEGQLDAIVAKYTAATDKREFFERLFPLLDAAHQGMPQFSTPQSVLDELTGI